jgi:glycosyltransferase involved in cell wall biosynthesis
MRIALLLESDGPGGAEKMLLHLAEELRERDHDVMPVGPVNGCGWLAAEFRDRGFEPSTFRLRRPLDWGCVQGLSRLLRERRIELVHSHEFTLAIYGAAAARLVRLPHVVTMHGGEHFAGRWQRRAALRWSFGLSRGVVAVSHTTRAALESALGLPSGRVAVIPNGIEARGGRGDSVRRELGVAPDERLIVAVGNLYPVKGHITLLRALDRLWEQGVRDWRLAIAGRGEEHDALDAFAHQRRWADRLHLLGYRGDVPDLLAAADVYAMPSLSEGLPLALLEAMFAEKAIVASNTGGIPEVVRHGEHAVLAEPSDPESLAAALHQLLSDARYRARLARSARRHAEETYTVGRMTDAYEGVYFGGRAPTAPRLVGA